jgi:hypothetical protein
MNTPCVGGCSSTLFHRVDCRLAHPEIAALPAGLPTGVEVTLRGRMISVAPIRHAPKAHLAPDNARCLARELLLAADEVERSAR